MFVCPKKRDAETAEKPVKEIGIVKRIFIVLVALMILLTSASLAEDLSALSDEELFTLCRDVLDEIERRQSAPAGSETQEDLPSFATINEALAIPVPASLDSDDTAIVLGMEYEGKYIRVVAMLDEHAKELRRAAPRSDDFSGWEAFDQYACELPVSRIEEFTERPKNQAELDALVGKTLPEILQEGYTSYAVWGEGEPRDLHVIALASGLYSYAFEFDMTDEDYTKYVDEDLIGNWPAKSVRFYGFSNEAMSVDYNPDGTPGTDTASIGKAAAGPADTDASPDLPVFDTVRGVRDNYTSAFSSYSSGNPDSLVLLKEINGRYFRAVTMLDERGKELYQAGMCEDGGFTISDEFYRYAETLPVSYVDEFTVKPMEQAELDAMEGRTIRDLEEEYDCRISVSRGAVPPPAVDLSFGIYRYTFEVDGTYTGSADELDWFALKDMTVKNGVLSGFSSRAADSDFDMDGISVRIDLPAEAEAESADSAAEPPVFATISEAYESSEGSSLLSRDADFAVLVLTCDGKYLRVVSALDDHAKELYRDAWGDGTGSGDTADAFYAYAETLPVSYIEEFAEQPLEQEKLDALDGKTLRELQGEGYSPCFYSDGESRQSDCIGLDYGFYSYTFDADENYRKFLETDDYNDMMNITVRNGRFSGFSGCSTDLSCSADQTFEEDSETP